MENYSPITRETTDFSPHSSLELLAYTLNTSSAMGAPTFHHLSMDSYVELLTRENQELAKLLLVEIVKGYNTEHGEIDENHLRWVNFYNWPSEILQDCADAMDCSMLDYFDEHVPEDLKGNMSKE